MVLVVQEAVLARGAFGVITLASIVQLTVQLSIAIYNMLSGWTMKTVSTQENKV